MKDDFRLDAATLEVLRNALDATAEEMGAVLRRTAFSPNIKERMDASCALFDRHAQLVAQAEHVPVHLGSMLSALAMARHTEGRSREPTNRDPGTRRLVQQYNTTFSSISAA